MIKPFQSVLVGFSSFERSTFESFFRLATRRVRGCEIIDDIAWSDFAIVNSDNALALAAFLKAVPKQKVLLIGQTDAGTGWPVHSRPIKLMAILTQIDQLLGGKVLVPRDGTLRAVVRSPAVTQVPAAKPTAPELLTKVEASVSPSMARVPASPPNATPKPRRMSRNSDFNASSNFMGLDGPSAVAAAPGKASRFDDILVVDDSDVALKFMKSRLYRFGFRAELARSGEEALVRVAQNDFKFVFLDVMMQGLDGYQTCRAIKQQKYGGANPPVVVMLTSRGGKIDKIRGSLAGCDAYLTKPLNEAELLAVLSKHDEQVQRGFQSTSSARSTRQ
ncbi:MAG: response regulator [Polaromonas sp.]|nr:response regulator [Polaromonas sp.]